MTPFGSALFFASAKLMDLQPNAIMPTIKVMYLSDWYLHLSYWTYGYMLIDKPSSRLSETAQPYSTHYSTRQSIAWPYLYQKANDLEKAGTSQ